MCIRNGDRRGAIQLIQDPIEGDPATQLEIASAL